MRSVYERAEGVLPGFADGDRWLDTLACFGALVILSGWAAVDGPRVLG